MQSRNVFRPYAAPMNGHFTDQTRVANSSCRLLFGRGEDDPGCLFTADPSAIILVRLLNIVARGCSLPSRVYGFLSDFFPDFSGFFSDFFRIFFGFFPDFFRIFSGFFSDFFGFFPDFFPDFFGCTRILCIKKDLNQIRYTDFKFSQNSQSKIFGILGFFRIFLIFLGGVRGFF